MPRAQEPQNSKLIQRLREISRGAPAPIGFGRVAEVTTPAMLVVSILPRNDVSLAEAAVQAGANVVTLRICGAGTDLLKETGDLNAELAAIQETIKAVGERATVGLIIGSNGAVAPDDLTKIGTLGVDFVMSYPHLTPAGFLELADVGRLAILDHQGGTVARGINDLSIQGALVRLDRPSDSPAEMTVLDVATYRAAADMVHRPIIAFPSWKPTPHDVEVLKNAGLEGLALVGPRPEATAEDISQLIRPYHDVVKRLGKPVGRRVALTEPAVILPRIAALAGEEVAEEPDEDE
ncbi:MAG TPA: hypothetical protein VFZ25_01135 [Chloroflexota bacterium]|nr:hypothetical protein [Chloroflexota bacterium]